MISHDLFLIKNATFDEKTQHVMRKNKGYFSFIKVLTLCTLTAILYMRTCVLHFDNLIPIIRYTPTACEHDWYLRHDPFLW